MSRTLSSLIALVGITATSLLSSCGSHSPTAPLADPVDPNAGMHEITVNVHHFKIRGACEGASTNPGEFYYDIRIMTLGGRDTLALTQGRLTGLPGAVVQPATHEFRFIMDPATSKGFEVEPRCSEYDNGVADSRMNERGTTAEHTFVGGTNWSNGLKVLQLGDTSCGYEIQYDVSVKAL
jgi:hypothetical protein